ncbi:hypothetical protein BJY24_001854 [Nocardia transvalensis]|uniref:Uncharacterized protein n=1 Tax=Nocardia transvalensis TaxID=37333 RepID=A0A7W9PBF5_9NOCA|nr:hypothetical protein [Nocardia transvalensis]MBB5912987.1 hypothetical protein [Nocardia transvalensis]
MEAIRHRIEESADRADSRSDAVQLTFRQVENFLGQFPNWAESSDEYRRLRQTLYRPLIEMPVDKRAQAVELTMEALEEATGA